MANKKANGEGTIRKRKNGTWEARYCAGTNPGTGQPIRKSVYGKTKAEVREKLTKLTAARDDGDLFEASKMTVGNWLTIWTENYLDGVKYLTAKHYKAQVEAHLRPMLGGVKLSALTPPMIQAAYSKMAKEGQSVPKRDENGKIVKGKDGKTVYVKAPLSAKSIRNIHGIFTKSLSAAVDMGYIRENPCNRVANYLPRVEKDEPRYLTEDERAAFLRECVKDEYAYLFLVTFWLGLRESEASGLTWDCIDFDKGTVTIKQQLIKRPKADGGFELASPKNGKTRTNAPAPFVMDYFKARKAQQIEQRFAAGDAWVGWQNEDERKTSLVFTTLTGSYLSPQTIYNHYKKIAHTIGADDTCVHSLRHTHVVFRLELGDNIKTISEDVGHYSSAFTLDRYGHVSPSMRDDSAAKAAAYNERLMKNAAV